MRAILGVLVFVSFASLSTAAEFFVAPDGNDVNAGTQDKPFATLERARDAVRALKKAGSSAASISTITTVWLRGGVYMRDKSFALTQEDSGANAAAPIVYRAWKDEEARLIGGRAIRVGDFKPVSDPQILNRLDPAARGKVLQCDLQALGIKHCNSFPDLFMGNGGVIELFFNNQRMGISRWPNDGYTTMKEVLDSGATDAGKKRGGVFVYRGDRPTRWKAALDEGLWLAGFWRVPWVIQAVRVQSIDTAKQVITQAAPVSGGIGSKYTPEVSGTRKGDGKEAWYALNLIEEIDQPGEWAINFKTKTLYFWPPAALEKASVMIADMDTPIVSLKDASYVTLRGLTIEGGLAEAVRVEGGAGVRVAGCAMRNTGKEGAIIAGGKDNGVQSCDLYNLGAAGIVLSGGDRKSLTPAGNFAVNNHIHHLGQVVKVVSGVVMNGVGNRLANNLIHDGPNCGVTYGGNEQILELNEIHNIGLDSGDLGCFYSGADWASRGNVVRYNFVHHSPGAEAVYLDDGDSGDTVFGNIAYKTLCGPFVGGGHDHIIRNNLLVECGKAAIHVDDRGISRRYDRTSRRHMSVLESVNYQQPPWRQRYPDLLKILDFHPELPTGIVIENNVMFGCKKNYDLPTKEESRRYITLKDNLELTEAPGFVDAMKLDFRLREDSVLRKKLPMFQPIPFEKIGLYLDEYRRALPTAAETGRNEGRKPRQIFDSTVDVARTNEMGANKP